MKRYNNLNALRALAAIGVLFMHVSVNLGYSVAGIFLIDNLVFQFGSLVRLFFIISGFSMCCGYYEKIKRGEISLFDFYSRRYLRVLPFFALLVVMDLAASLVFSGGIPLASIYEAFANMTLMTGLLSAGDFSVIGVGWTLGVIFGFYIIFPFFVFLTWTRLRAWITLAVTLVVYYLCVAHFDFGTMQCNVLMWLCYFVAGGLLYLYREEIGRVVKHPLVGIGLIVLGFYLLFYTRGPKVPQCQALVTAAKFMVCYSLMVAGCLGPDNRLLSNPVTDLLSRVSLEVYLSHMMIFRVFEKLGLLAPLGQNRASWVLVSLMTLVCTVLFALGYQWVERRVTKLLKK